MALDYSHLGLNDRLRRVDSISPQASTFYDEYSFNAESDSNLISAQDFLKVGTIDVRVGTIGTAVVTYLDTQAGTLGTIDVGSAVFDNFYAANGTVGTLDVDMFTGDAEYFIKQYALLVNLT